VGKLENKPSHRDCPRARRAKPRQAQSARRETKDVELSDSTTIGAAQSAQHAENCYQVNSIGANRKAIFNRDMIPNIPENPRARKTTKRGRKQRFDPAIFEERFRTIERVFAWEDKFRRLLQRFERLSLVHYAFKTLAYAMINLRHYC
jgi:hypothetical protein